MNGPRQNLIRANGPMAKVNQGENELGQTESNSRASPGKDSNWKKG